MHPRRLIVAALAALTLAACTPAQVQWWSGRVEEARTAGLHCPDLAPAMELYHLPPIFDYIAWRESRCTPTVVNASSGALGLTQIMPMWVDELCHAAIACSASDLLDAHTNLAAARFILDRQGMGAWSP